MEHQPVRKLNKRLIFWSLIGLIAMSTPAIISLATFNQQERVAEQNRNEPHIVFSAHDTGSITGTEHFPETYSDVHNFEKEQAISHKPKVEVVAPVEEVEAPMDASKTHQEENERGFREKDDPWEEAHRREKTQIAHDYYDARRSGIMFVNNAKEKGAVRRGNEEDILAGIEKQVEEDTLLVKKNGEKDFNKRLSASGKADRTKNSSHVLSEGTLIHAILLSEINTDLPGPILARVSHNIWDSKTGQVLLLPQNSKLIGEYNSSVGHGQKRAQIVWKRVIYPNQQSVDLAQMVGVDQKGTSGTAGIVDNHYDKVAFALLLTTTLGAGVRMTQGKYDPNSASIGDDFGNSLAQETARVGSRIADKMLSIKPTITVSIGERLNVFVEQNLYLAPYNH